MQYIRNAIVAVIVGFPAVAGAQPAAAPPCGAPAVVIPPTKQAIALSVRQEVDLGDAIAEHLQQFFRVVEDDAAAGLQAIGDRIVRQLPAAEYQFRFMLVNLPTANAFALPGGRVYVSRKLIASIRNEDELAGILAHEIGHVVTRQLAAEMSLIFSRTLKVTSFGDRRDVFEKYARLAEHQQWARGSGERRHQSEQIEADNVGVRAVAAAGYAPAAYVDFWDRFSEADGRTGNFFTNLLGATRPEARRLREQLRTLTTLPEACRNAQPRAADQTFEAWRTRAIAGSGRNPSEAVRALVSETKLNPPVGGDLTSVAFSPDGRYVLAQAESSIHVLSREPFAVLFSIDVDAARARFTPDSARIVLNTSDLRIETWDLATRSPVSVREVVARPACATSELSPDGTLLGCLTSGFSIIVFDLRDGAEVYRKLAAYGLDFFAHQTTTPTAFILTPFQLAFSPDSRYFIVGHASGETVVDVHARAEVKLAGPVRAALRQPFAFVGGDRLVAVDPQRPEDSRVLRFPSGDLLKRLRLGGSVSAVTRGNAVIIRPLKDWALGVVDLSSGAIVTASHGEAFDAYDDLRVSQQVNGNIALSRAGSDRPFAVAVLPTAQLGRVHAVDVSENLERLAMSGRDRGGLWNLATGEREVHIRRFDAVHLGNGTLFADFPARRGLANGKSVAMPRAMVQIDLATRQATDRPVAEDDSVQQVGRYLLESTAAKVQERDRNVTLTVRDVRTNQVLWTRFFDGGLPYFHPDAAANRLILEYQLSSAAARRALEQQTTLRAQATAEGLRGEDSYLEVLDFGSGEVAGRLLVNTGRDPLRLRAITSSGDAVVVADRSNNVSVYSLASGVRRGRAFGELAVPSTAAGLVCVRNDPREVDCYDLQSMEHQAEIRLSASVRVLHFSGDGRRLLVVTSDQTAKTFDTAGLRGPR